MQQLQKSGHFAKVCRTKTVNRVHEEDTGSNTESWSEIDHIHSVNGINRVDFHKAILLVEGQPIEFIIDTGSPVTIIPPIINPKEIKATSKCFVDVKKSIKFKGEAMVEVKTEKNKNNTTHLNHGEEKHTTYTGIQMAEQTGNPPTGKPRNKHHPTKRNCKQKGEKSFEEFENLFKKNHTIKNLTIDIQLKKRHKTYPTKRKTSTHTLSNDSIKRNRKVNRKTTLGKSGQNDRKLLSFTSRHNNQRR